MELLSSRCVFKTYTVLNKHFTRLIGLNASTVIDQVENVKPWSEIPGPRSLPFIGPIPNFLPGGKLYNCKGIKLSERLYELYGPIVRLDAIFGGYPTLVLFDPEAVEHVLRSEEPMPIRPTLETLEYYRMRHNKTYDPNRIIGLNNQGESWRNFRSKVNPIMMHPKIIKLYSNVLNEVACDMIERLKCIRDERNKITKNFYTEINLWALESIGVVALGTRLNCFDPNLPADSPVRKLIQNAHDIFEMGDKLDFRPSLWRLLSTPNFKKAMKVYEEHERLTKYFIEKAMKEMEEPRNSSPESPNSEKPILEKLLQIDVNTACVMASDMLLAGIDTTANTVIATLYLLAINPEKQSKLREELLSNQTEKPYLKACIKEGMRMLPVVIGNARLSTKEYNLLGYIIPKGVFVLFAHQYMSNMEANYPRPNEYLPERWLTNKDDPLYHGKTNRFVTATFGYGVRTCVGRRIAELEIKTFMTKLIENFQVDWTGPEPIQFNPTSLNYITEPFHFVFKDL